MKKIELNTIASQNMTVVSEEVLSEVNGGCTFKYGTWSTSCGGSWTGWKIKKYCSWRCPVETAEFTRKWYAPSSQTTLVVSPHNPYSESDKYMWDVEWYNGNQGIVVSTRYGRSVDKIFKVY